MTAATPETVTELDPLVMAQLQPPCEALIYREADGSHAWGYGSKWGPNIGTCPSPAEYVMTLAAGCACIYTGVAHLLGCGRHSLMVGTHVFCQCCQAASTIVSLDAL